MRQPGASCASCQVDEDQNGQIDVSEFNAMMVKMRKVRSLHCRFCDFEDHPRYIQRYRMLQLIAVLWAAFDLLGVELGLQGVKNCWCKLVGAAVG